MKKPLRKLQKSEKSGLPKIRMGILYGAVANKASANDPNRGLLKERFLIIE